MDDSTLYDIVENIRSSDEYSVRDDRLHNIRTNININSKPKAKYNMSAVSKKYKKAARVKKRSVNWINKKNLRQNYKIVLQRILKGNIENDQNKSVNSSIPQETIYLGTVKETQKSSVLPTVDSKLSRTKTFVKPEKETHKIIAAFPNRKSEQEKKNFHPTFFRKFKRSRSLSPTLLQLNDKDFPVDPNINHNTLLNREVNKLFPQYNKILKDYVQCSIGTAERIEKKINQIFLELQALSDMIKTKELEWNKLLHLRKVKEEVLLHLTRKKNLIELKERDINSHDFRSFECRESSKIFFETSNILQSVSKSSSITQSLVESRANMRKEDLEIEKLDINRLYSILVSGNILHNSQGMNVYKKQDQCVPKFSIQQFKTDELFQRENKEKKQTASKEFKPRHDNLDPLNNFKTNPDDGKFNIIENEVPMCQACKINEALFVCAGCGNQWYCSRKCQVTAWDKHSFICKE